MRTPVDLDEFSLEQLTSLAVETVTQIAIRSGVPFEQIVQELFVNTDIKPFSFLVLPQSM